MPNQLIAWLIYLICISRRRVVQINSPQILDFVLNLYDSGCEVWNFFMGVPILCCSIKLTRHYKMVISSTYKEWLEFNITY